MLSKNIFYPDKLSPLSIFCILKQWSCDDKIIFLPEVMSYFVGNDFKGYINILDVVFS